MWFDNEFSNEEDACYRMLGLVENDRGVRKSNTVKRIVECYPEGTIIYKGDVKE